MRLRLAVFSLAIALPLLLLLGWGLQTKFVEDRADAMDRLQAQRIIAERTLTNYFERLRFKLTELELIADFSDFTSPTLREQCLQFLRLHPEFINVGVLDRHGILRYSTAFPVADPPQDYSKMPNIREQLTAPGFYVSTAARGQTTGRWGCVVGKPLTSDNHLLLSTPIDLKVLSKTLFFAPDAPELVVTVLDRNNTIVLTSHLPDTRIGDVRPNGSRVRELLRRGQSTGEIVGVDGITRTYDAALIPVCDWVVTVSVPTEAIYHDAWHNLRNAGIAVLLTIVALAFLVHYYSRALIRPVLALANTARDHAAGHRESLATLDGPAEIADTARAFNEMVRARQRAEAGLIESELRYRTIVEQTGQMVYDLDIATGRVRWFGSQAIRDITGETLEEFTSVDEPEWSRRIHPDEREAVLAILKRSVEDKTPFVTEYRFRHKDGSYRVIEDFGIVIANRDGRAVRMLGRMNDITGRRNAEAALRESEDRYRTVIEQTGQMVYQVEHATGQIKWFGTEAVLSITGYTLAELQELDIKEFAKLFHPDDAPQAAAFFDARRPHGGSYHTEYRLRHKDGSYRLVEDVGVFLRDETGRVFRSLGRLSDITARRAAELDLRELAAFQTAILDNATFGLIAVTPDGTIKYFNRAAERMLGYSAGEMVGLCTPEKIHVREEVVARAVQLSEQLGEPVSPGLDVFFAPSRHGLPNEQEWTYVRKDGSRFPVLLAISALRRTDGEISGYMGIAVDLTERKRAEEERQQIEKKLLETQKLESLGVLAGGIAHDFNNLLTGVLGNAGLARLTLPASAPASEQLQQIERAAQRAADLCKQMLAYSGKGRFVVQSLDLSELVQDTLSLLAVSVSKKALLRFQPGTGLPPVLADATQLRQVVMNLVINASEALEDRTGQITLTTGKLEVDAAYLATAQVTGEIPVGPAVYLEVSDTGCGMSRDTVARIFDPFFTTKFTGRGLGLAAVLGIVRGHRGAIKVYSEPGAGTTFRVLFPAAAGVVQPLTRPPTERPTWRGSGRVLVIDDEEAVRAVAVGILGALGFAADSASDGAEGVARFQADPSRYVAVLLDLTMPRVDGEETFRQLRVIRPDVKVILMSGFNRVDAINRFVGKGLAGFVQKPFQVETISAEMQRVLADGK